MPRYGLPPSDEPPTPMSPDDRSALTRWSWRAKVLAAVAGVALVVGFVFEFLPPTDTGDSQKISTTVAVTTTTTELSTTTLLPATTTPLSPTTAVPTRTTTTS